MCVDDTLNEFNMEFCNNPGFEIAPCVDPSVTQYVYIGCIQVNGQINIRFEDVGIYVRDNGIETTIDAPAIHRFDAASILSPAMQRLCEFAPRLIECVNS